MRLFLFSRLSLAEKLKLFSEKPSNSGSAAQVAPPSVRRKARRMQSRFKTQVLILLDNVAAFLTFNYTINFVDSINRKDANLPCCRFCYFIARFRTVG